MVWFGGDATPRRQRGNLFHEIFAVSKQDHARENGDDRQSQSVAVQPIARQRETGLSK